MAKIPSILSKLAPHFSYPEKNSLLYLLITLLFSLIFILIFSYFFQIPKPMEFIIPISGKEMMIKKQLKEIEELRKQANPQPLSEEDIVKEVKELDVLRKKAVPPSPEEIQKQLEELEKLRR